MSTFTQFFPTGGSSSSSGGGNIGGGTTPVEIIGVSGGGGRGGCYSCPTCSITSQRCQYWGQGGDGGTGAIFYADNYYITPGTTYPITVGTGGAGGTSAAGQASEVTTQGSNGGATSFNNPLCVLCVAGGGGGGAGTHTHDNTPTSINHGKRGGTGGAGGNWNKCESASYPLDQCRSCYARSGSGMYFRTRLEYERDYLSGRMTDTTYSAPNSKQVKISDAQVLQKPWGWMGGFPGADCRETCRGPSGIYCYSDFLGGGMMSNAAYLTECSTRFSPPACPANNEILKVVGCKNRFYTYNWGDTELSFGNHCGVLNDGSGPCIGAGGNPSNVAGSDGILVIRYPDQYAAATITNGTDISPQTPGYRTYCFTTSGSITL